MSTTDPFGITTARTSLTRRGVRYRAPTYGAAPRRRLISVRGCIRKRSRASVIWRSTCWRSSRIMDSPPTHNMENRDIAKMLIDSGYYRLSSGFPFGATHYRRSLRDSSCLHMVIEGGQRRLHHDTFDPHASLSSLSMHLTHEAKSEAVTYFAAAWGLVRLLAR